MRPEHEIAREKLEALMKEQGLTIASTFIPWSQSRNAPGRYEGHGTNEREIAMSKAKGWRSLNWRVTLRKNERDGIASHAIHITEYSAGEAHAPAYKHMAKKGPDHRKPGCLDWTAAMDYELEHGKPYNFRWVRITGGAPVGKNMKIEPDAVSVFAGLAQEGWGAIESGTFEDWARDLGYDVDSRKAEQSYDQCLKTGLALRRALGEKLFQEAAELAGQL